MNFHRLTLVVLVLLVLGWSGGGLVSPAGAEVINRIVAEVNNDVITLEDLNRAMVPVAAMVKKKSTPQTYPQALAQAQRMVLIQLIVQKLEEQQLKKLKIVTTPAMIERMMRQILARNNVSMERFLDRLKKRNVTLTQYRQEVKVHLGRRRLMRIVTRGKIIVSEQDVQDYFNQKVAGRPTAAGVAVHIRTIILSVPPGAGRSRILKARRLAGRIHARLKRGADFVALARKYNPEGLRENGGDLGTVPLAHMRPQMARLLQGLRQGQFTTVIRTPRGFQIIKKIGQSKAGGPALTQLTPQLRDRIRQMIHIQKMQQAYKKWIDELRQRSHVKVML
ncbi:MAG: SurA N-terminal domain-containing protein [Proteobacteria bacterium]|nr:SurA N-terminal domain-containing protein [Pseudomonadota bacterium]MBU1742109.1 SurA N-terminal domain-containing protein [Pseudomonadota bacterium]